MTVEIILTPSTVLVLKCSYRSRFIKHIMCAFPKSVLTVVILSRLLLLQITSDNQRENSDNVNISKTTNISITN